jgi:hypothetical protein
MWGVNQFKVYVLSFKPTSVQHVYNTTRDILFDKLYLHFFFQFKVLHFNFIQNNKIED